MHNYHFEGPNQTSSEAALARQYSDSKILLGFAGDTLETQSLSNFLTAHGYNIRLASSNRELLETASDGNDFDAIIVDQTITDQTLEELCRIPRAFFVPIIEFTSTQPREHFAAAAIPKFWQVERATRKVDTVISIARDIRQNGYLRAAYPELVELDKLFGPVGV